MGGSNLSASDSAASRARASTLAKYRPLLLLGRGGMGSVEAAVLDGDDEPRGAPRTVVALKRILRAEGSDRGRVEMFLREARLTTLLEHPNVVRALSYGEHGGELFLAMEYIAGEPLSRIVSLLRERGEQLPATMVAYILAEACEGLHAAHELTDETGAPLNVVHRDVSPHNVMVGFDGTVKLLDFGVAKIEALESAGRTKTGEVKGKTAYMSPEQAMGEAIDRRSDLYSVGAVLYECLTGRRMWGQGTDLDVLRRLALEEPPSLAEAATDVAPALLDLQRRLIARDPSLRPATAREVANELRAYVEASGMNIGPEALRTTMTRLFEDDRRDREEAIRRALESTHAEALANESGPVFATDAGVVSHVQPRRTPRTVVSGALLVLMVVSGGIALWYHDGRAPPAVAQPSHPETTATTPVHAASTAAPPVTQPVSPRAPPVTAPLAPPVRAPAVTDTRPLRPMPPKASADPPRSTAAPARSAPTPAPSPSSTPKPPEPPDVDPTPF